MASEESDIELSSALSKKKILKKPPRSPTSESLPEHTDPKKLTTKIMIQKALAALKTRKGVSLYAIKKYMEENFHVNTEKLNFYIKKYIKSGVEAGTIIQTKGIGAAGSFKLANVKERTEKKKIVKKTTKPAKNKSGTNEKPAKTKIPKKKKSIEEKLIKKPKKLTIGKEKIDNTEGKVPKQKKEKEVGKEDKEKMPKKKAAKSMAMKNMKAAKGAKTPAKNKSAMMKRKSIGSIIKPPKMKPKAHA